MGFCRRCGEIVSGDRCRCGGSSAAPIVAFKKASSDVGVGGDKWSRTYVASNGSSSATRPGVRSVQSSIDLLNRNTATSDKSTSSAKRFPKPTQGSSNAPKSQLASRVAHHVASTTTSSKPLKQTTRVTTLADPHSDIIPSLVDNTLSKVYGSVLQPKETLSTYSCALCAAPFPPDATIFPDPKQPNVSNPRFFCRPCYEANGGTKGPCAACLRPVLTLKSEGGFIHAADKYWHKRCFDCAGCFKNIGERPMVDLLGRPCCGECFDNCLKRDSPTKQTPTTKASSTSPRRDPKPSSHLGGISKAPQGSMTRESSPAIDELEQRLGIKRRQSIPVLEELTQRLSLSNATKDKDSSHRYSTGTPTASPIAKRSSGRPSLPLGNGGQSHKELSSPPLRRQHTGSAALEAVLEMKARLVQEGSSSSASPRPSNQKSTDQQTATRIKPRTSDRAPVSMESSPSIDSIERFSDQTGDQGTIRAKSRSSTRATSSVVSSTLSSQCDSLYRPLPDRPLKQQTTDQQTVRIKSHSRNRPTPSVVSSSSISDLDSLYSPLPTMPDLLSDFSDTNTQSSFSEVSDSPPCQTDEVELLMSAIAQPEPSPTGWDRPDSYDALNDTITKEAINQLTTPTKTSATRHITPTRPTVDISPLRPRKRVNSSPATEDAKSTSSSSSPSKCLKCKGKLFGIGNESTFVTLPSMSKGSEPEVYHTVCFTCDICDGPFKSERKGQASFVRHQGKPCHAECAPKERAAIYRSPSSPAMEPSTSVVRKAEKPSSSIATRARANTLRPVSSRLEQSLHTPVEEQPVPRFGSRSTCPGCKQAVSPMERGVIPGPQGTKWHSSCLVCGGKKVRPVSWYGARKDSDKAPTPGCGKKLDSAAKSDGTGGVWCRECMLILGLASSPQPSPVRTVLSPTYTGSGKVIPQFTGTKPATRSFATASLGEASLLRQLAGTPGSRHPTRSVSPSKHIGEPTARPAHVVRPRPKSVLGMRSVDEGRGMFLVRQFTGASSGVGDY